MSTIKVLVHEQSLRVTDGPKIASRGVNENVVEFAFDESWDGFGKTAIFYKEFHEENVYQSIIDSDGIASVPHEVTDTECKVCFGVVGINGNIIYTTEVIKYNIVKGVPISGSESEPPSPTIYQQMLSLVGQVQSDVDSFESDTNDKLDVMSSQMDEFIAEHAGTYGKTTLWDSDNASGETISGNTQTVTLAEDCSEYDYIDIYFGDYVRTNTGVDFVGHTQTFFEPDYNNKQVQLLKWQFGPASNDPDGIHFKITYHDTSWSWSGNAIDDAEVFGLSHVGYPFDKIVGRKLVADAELVDARVGVNGTVYQTVGAAIRGQINDVAGGTVELDTTLTQQGKAADAKAVGDKIGEIKADLEDLDDRVEALEAGGGGSGLTDAVKTALLQLAQKVAYIDDDGQDYYDDLYNALYPPADLVSISAVYTQSGTVYETSDLDDLRNDLVVTATYDDSTTQAVTTYTLSGTLTEGTSTITVSYGGKTATFTVTVTQYVSPYWKVLSVENDFYGVGLTTTYKDTLEVDGYGTAQGVRQRNDRTSYLDFDLLLDTNYTYEFEFDGNVSIGLPRYDAVPWAGVDDLGWKSSEYVLDPNDGNKNYCFRITLNKGKSDVLASGCSEIRIIRTPANE